MSLWWCPKCGVVWAADAAPLCRHMVIDGPAIARMERLPRWHPYADAPSGGGSPNEEPA